MAVKCSNCGEELLGAVNRCWKCGSAFVAPPMSANVPPVRRAPIMVLYPPSESAGAETEIVLAQDGVEVVSATTAEGGASKPPLPGALPARRRGSPFADDHTAKLRANRPPAALARPPTRRSQAQVDYARNSAATGGAIAALLLGIFGMCGSYYVPAGALVTAVLGIGMGLWGLYSDRRGLAIAGLLLCCLTLAMAGFFGAIELYVFINGRNPWELDPSLQTGPAGDF